MRKRSVVQASFIIVLFFSLCVTLSVSPMQSSSIMVIDLEPSVVVSGTNFSVSVYDPTIHNMTPYLVDVTIEFNGEYYEITEDTPGGELTLTAPLVTSKKQYLIAAFKEGYEPTNTTLTVDPSPSNQLVITVGSYEVDAKKPFSVLVTDEDAEPIANATVWIQGETSQETRDVTNSEGFAILRAPNKQELVIVAQKNGYLDATKNIWVKTNPSFIDSLLSNPLLPVILAVVVLGIVIVYVQVSKQRNISSGFFDARIKKSIPDGKKKNQTKKTIPSSPSRTKETRKKQHTNTITSEKRKVEEPIKKESFQTITDSPSQQNHREKKKETVAPHQHKWFDDSSAVEQKVDDLTQKKEKEVSNQWFSKKQTIEDEIDASLQKKQKKDKKQND